MKAQSLLIQSLAALAFFSERTVASGSSLRSSSSAASSASSAAVDPTVIDPPCSNHCKKLRLGPDKMTACLEKYCGLKRWSNEGGVADLGASAVETTMAEKDSAASSTEETAGDMEEDDDVAECERRCRMKRWAPRLVEESVRGCHHDDQSEHDNEGGNAADEEEQDAEDDTSGSDADADEENHNRQADQFANGNDAQDEENSDPASVAKCERRCRMRRWGQTKLEQCLRECQENSAANRTTDEYANDDEDENDNEDDEEEGDSSDGTSEQDEDGDEPDGDYFMECVRNCKRKRWVRRLMDQCIEDCHSQNHLDGGEGFDVDSDESTAGTTATKKLI